MPDQVLQIGPFAVSKAVFDVLVPLLSSLAGTAIGGLIAYWSIRASDNRKWEQVKQDKLMAERREAIAIALEWFDPLRNGITEARLLIGSFLQQRLSEEDVRMQWPDLLNSLVKKEPPPRLQLWLPSDTDKRVFEIIRGLSELIDFNFSAYPSTSDEWRKKFVQYGDYIRELAEAVDNLEMELKEEYKKTFD